MIAVTRALVCAALLLAAVVLQVSLFDGISYDGVVPSLVLLIVVGAALTRGAEFAMTLGFLGGILLDLAPPADHVAGRWALALVVAGYLAGRVRQDAGQSALASVVTVAATSFVATSLFALSGLLLQDDSVSVGEALRVIPISVGYDVLLTPFVLPLVMKLFQRLDDHQVAFS
ncbi:MAG TPA: rod shape-determining protein MreD [Nocardioidaceae bacterium]|nr:rod shape-determining protein MreD [Nocardioidaceae bacterium]